MLLIDEMLTEKLEVLDELASGSFGTLYRVRQRSLDRIAAMKVLHALSEDSILARFRREAKALSAINHPNVVQIFDHGQLSDGRPYMVMQFIDGEMLSNRLCNGPLSLSETQALLTNLCVALEAVHAVDVVHRDLKPDNIMFSKEDGSLKLIDFGMMRPTGTWGENTARLTALGTAIGTVAYMSPEQCLGKETDRRADIYALGCVIYECLTGAPPFMGDNVYTVMQQHAYHAAAFDEAATLRADRARQKLEKIVLRCLSKDPANRYQTAMEISDALASEAMPEVTEKPLKNGMPPAIKAPSRALNWILVGAVSAFILVYLLANNGLMNQSLRDSRREPMLTHNEYRESLKTVPVVDLDSIEQMAPIKIVSMPPICRLVGRGQAPSDNFNTYYLAKFAGRDYDSVRYAGDADFDPLMTVAAAPDGRTALVSRNKIYEILPNHSRKLLVTTGTTIHCARFDHHGLLYFTAGSQTVDETGHSPSRIRFKLFRIDDDGKPAEYKHINLAEAPSFFTGEFAFDREGDFVLSFDDKYRVSNEPTPGRSVYVPHRTSAPFVLVRPKGRNFAAVVACSNMPASWDLDRDGNLVFINGKFHIGRRSHRGLERFADAPFLPICISVEHGKR